MPSSHNFERPSPAEQKASAACLPAPAAAGQGVGTQPMYAVSGNETRTGRPAVHASAAERKRAYRAAKARIDYTDSPEIVAKLHETAAELDCSVNELLRSMVRFAQTNRNWKQLGLFGARRNGELQ